MAPAVVASTATAGGGWAHAADDDSEDNGRNGMARSWTNPLSTALVPQLCYLQRRREKDLETRERN
jgi:hypothetical protein